MSNQTIEEEVLDNLVESLTQLRVHKPEQRSEVARRWAITITEMEKVVAYFKMYAVDYIDAPAMDIDISKS